METLLNRKKSISVAKTDHFLWCRHSLPNSKVLSPPRSFGNSILANFWGKSKWKI